MNRRVRNRAVGFLLLLIATWPAAAHDFWLEPANFRPAPGETVPVVIRVGENLTGISQPYIPDWCERYSATGPSGEKPVSRNIGDDPAGSFTPDAAGNWVVGYLGKPDVVTLDAPKFDAYLRAEGLEWVLAARAHKGVTAAPATERYSRCAKALLQVGGPGRTPDFDRRLGLPLEIVPERDPYRLSAGDSLRVRVYYAGRPLSGMLISAVSARRPSEATAVRTDAQGRAEFELTEAGMWLVKGVHIIELPPSDADADWESFWASLTFEFNPRNDSAVQ